MRGLGTWIRERRRRGAPPGLGGGFAALYDCEYLGVAMISPSGRFLKTNGPLQRMLGYDEHELAGMTFNEITHPDDVEECAAEFARLQRGEIENFELEKRYLRKDGSVLWTHVVVAAVRQAGRLLHTVGVVVDITPRKLAQENVRRLTGELEERVKRRTAEVEYQTALCSAVMAVSPDGIAIVDHDAGRVLSCNRRFVEMWSLPPEIEASGSLERVVAHILPQLADPEKAIASLNAVKKDRERREYDEARLADGRLFEYYSCPISAPDGRTFGRVSYWHDVTRRALAESELREKSARLLRSNEELDDFASSAAHDLAAPLRKITTFGGLLQMTQKDRLDPEGADILGRMLACTAVMEKLVAQILALARAGREVLPPEDVDLNRVASEAVSFLEGDIAAARASVEVGPLPVVRAHASLLRRVLQNLISNAVKFRRPDARPRVRVFGRRGGGGELRLSVADNGIGFRPEDSEKIFKPFTRLHSAAEYPGSGIGLSTCRRIAERYGGRIEVASRPGRGSLFTLVLPAEMLAAPRRGS